MNGQSSPFPWHPLTALLLALAAQVFLEPPARFPAALALYILAGIFVIWSFRRHELTLPENPPSPNPALSEVEGSRSEERRVGKEC